MSTTRKNKTLAVVFIILFLGYYQKWLYALIYESVDGSVDLDPALPMIIDGIQKVQSLHEEDSAIDERVDSELQIEREVASAMIPAMTYLQTNPELQAKADGLSQRIQLEIDAIQNSSYKGCKGPKISCGPSLDCGLGCQIHSVMSCLMVAHMTNRTLIPNFRNWPSLVPWTDVFQPISNPNCQVDNETALVRWGKTGFSLNNLHGGRPYIHKSGLPVPVSISPELKELPTNQFLWWVSQYAKYTMRLQPYEKELMQKFKDVLKLQYPTVGIVVRKRDKRGEKRKLETHSIDRYMSLAKRYFAKLEETQDNITRRVFLSTDDRNVIKLVRKRYRPPRWEILGFQRKTDLEDMVKDIYMLSACHFVVCSFSVDICRLVLELKEAKELNSVYRIKSVGRRPHMTSSKNLDFLHPTPPHVITMSSYPNTPHPPMSCHPRCLCTATIKTILSFNKNDSKIDFPKTLRSKLLINFKKFPNRRHTFGNTYDNNSVLFG